MGIINSNDIRKGTKLLLDGDAFVVVDADHVKPGKGSAFARVKMKSLRTGSTWEKTFKAGDKVETAETQERKMQFLYKDPDGYHFMDHTSYEQLTVSPEVIGDAANFMPENIDVSVLFHGDEVLGVELPNFIITEIVDTEPGFKGDTVSGGKPAKCATGCTVSVPFHLTVGDKIMVDTRSGAYLKKM